LTDFGIRFTSVVRRRHVGVVGGNRADVENVSLCETDITQRNNVRLGHLTRNIGELLHVPQHRHPSLTQSSGPPISVDGSEEIIVLEESPQTAAMVGHSVMAVVHVTHNQGDEFTLNLSQGPCARHCSVIDAEMAFQA